MDKSVLEIMNANAPTLEQRAHTMAAILAAPCKMVDGKLVFSRQAYRESYDRHYNLFLGTTNKDA